MGGEEGRPLWALSTHGLGHLFHYPSKAPTRSSFSPEAGGPEEGSRWAASKIPCTYCAWCSDTAARTNVTVLAVEETHLPSADVQLGTAVFFRVIWGDPLGGDEWAEVCRSGGGALRCLGQGSKCKGSLEVRKRAMGAGQSLGGRRDGGGEDLE